MLKVRMYERGKSISVTTDERQRVSIYIMSASSFFIFVPPLPPSFPLG